MNEALTGVTNAQLYLVIGVPLLFNSIMFIVTLAYMESRFKAIDRWFNRIDRRLDVMLGRTERR